MGKMSSVDGWSRVAPLLVLAFCAENAFGQRAQSISPHGDIREGLACEACHSGSQWTPLRADLLFDHGVVAGFALLGAHASTDCASCHGDLRFDRFERVGTDCSACHEDVHLASVVQSCERCHSATSFNNVDGLSIHAETNFPLAGTHLLLTCASCHADDTGGAFSLLDTGCYSCHEDDYTLSRTLDHEANSLSTECVTCHNELSWRVVRFEHLTVSSGFALLGAHELVPCEACHTVPDLTPRFMPTSDQDCYSCHAADYESEHAGSGFSQTCTTCHDVNSWEGSLLEHDNLYFPIYRGEHRGEWDSCQTCHVSPLNYAIFSCIDCHEHSESRMDSEHRNRPGYSWDSLACYSCHPDGRE